MNATEFSRRLADKTGHTHNEILIFGRALAEGEVREIGRGRHAPDITCAEAVMLLLAVLSGRPARHAAEAARDLGNFELLTGQSNNALKALHYLFGVENSFEHLIKKNLSELLVLLSKRIAGGKLGQDNFVWLEISDGAIATLQAELNWLPEDRSQKLGLEEEIVFTGGVSIPDDDTRGNFYRSLNASWRLLGWIGEVTA